MNSLITISHAHHRAVDYKELIKVLNDQLVDAQTKVETLTSSEKDLKSKVEQAEKTVAERNESLRGLADENQKQTQINKSLTDQLEKLTHENKELKREKEADLARYEEICFNCFYQVWKLNKPFNLDFLTEEAKAKELSKCEAKAAEEAANPAGTTPFSPTLSFQPEEATDAEEGVDQPDQGAS
ncbi:uncharacterized protein LOC133794040 [Humulus lupulus]|uniref:uncharacterized protein LOC133794040 n=1 Tax=Humulus lupulus TaxID=3486 RepID=UPI002B40F9FE|nr:uncharacterized protein LOC133794040 [Humulus lupulus]